jgi:hypothetical protein
MEGVCWSRGKRKTGNKKIRLKQLNENLGVKEYRKAHLQPTIHQPTMSNKYLLLCYNGH